MPHFWLRPDVAPVHPEMSASRLSLYDEAGKSAPENCPNNAPRRVKEAQGEASPNSPDAAQGSDCLVIGAGRVSDRRGGAAGGETCRARLRARHRDRARPALGCCSATRSHRVGWIGLFLMDRRMDDSA